MHRTFIALAAGLAIGAGALTLRTVFAAAEAQTAPGFQAVSVSSTGSNLASVSWFIGKDGSARVCATNGATYATCVPVKF